jgi:hypothetical protein
MGLLPLPKSSFRAWRLSKLICAVLTGFVQKSFVSVH